MEMETKKKRSYTVPVLLVLLTFSLIGNVFLYSQHLQHGQDTKQADGQAIINHGIAAKAHVDAVLNALNGLEAVTAAERSEKLYKLGQASTGQVDLLGFILDAHHHTIAPSTTDDETVQALEALSGKLAAISAQSGELSAEDQQSIVSLQALYSKLKEQLASFQLESGDKLVEMSVLTGGSWVGIGLALEQTITGVQSGTTSNG